MPHLPAFMAAAPSMSAGSHKMRDIFSKQDPPRSIPYTAPSITPYLGLRARLSQIWLNRWTILLLLVLVRSLLAVASVNDGLGSARREALEACSKVESMGSAMASMPHYMSRGMNEVTAGGIERAVNGLMQTTTLAVTAMQEIVIFVINMMTSTYLCLITFAVTGSLKAVLNVMDSAQEQLNDMTKNLGDDMAGMLKDFNGAYDAIKDKLKGGFLGVGSDVNLPTLNIDNDIKKLRDLKLPDGLGADIQKLNNSIPTFKEVQDTANNLIRIPFEEIKKLINESMGTYTFDRSFFPIPQKENLSFCGDDDGINGFFATLFEIAAKAKTAFLGVLIVAAVLACIPMGWREIRRYRAMKAHSQLLGSNEHDPMDVVYIVSRPYTATAGIKASGASKSERRKVLIRWVIAYATTDAALFVLSLAVAGLFSCLCQYILLKSIEKEVPGLASHVGDFTEKVILKLNNASEQWAVGANAAIMKTNDSINADLFGWVNTSTTALNSTLNQFVEITSEVLDKTFGNGPLREPVQEVLNCLVLLKVAGFQKGLTWIHDHAHINLPLMRNDTFSLGAVESIASDAAPDQSFLANPGDKASNKISDVIARFMGKFYQSLQTEALISTVVLMIWLAVVFIGLGRALVASMGSDKIRGEGGAAPFAAQDANTPAMMMEISGPNNLRTVGQVGNRHHDTFLSDNVSQSRHQASEDRQVDYALPTYHTAVNSARSIGSGNNSHVSQNNHIGLNGYAAVLESPFSDRNRYQPQQDRIIESNMNPPFTEAKDAYALADLSHSSSRRSSWDQRTLRNYGWEGDSKA